jgi:hypothetical protein
MLRMRRPASQSLALLLRVYAMACTDAGAPCGVQLQPSDSGDHPVAKSSPSTPLPTAARLHRSLVRRRVHRPRLFSPPFALHASSREPSRADEGRREYAAMRAAGASVNFMEADAGVAGGSTVATRHAISECRMRSGVCWRHPYAISSSTLRGGVWNPCEKIAPSLAAHRRGQWISIGVRFALSFGLSSFLLPLARPTPA